MKKIILAALFFVLAFQIPAFAAGPLKIGVVDRGDILKKSEPGQAALNKLKSQSEGMRQDLERQKKDIEKMRDDLQKQNMVLSMEAKQEKDLQFKRKIRDFQDTQAAYEQKMKAAEGQALDPVWKMLNDVIKDYGKKNEFSLILESNEIMVVYSDQAINLNAALIQELNNAWKARGNK